MGLKIGDILPNFSAIDTNGAVFHSKDYIGKQSVVIYFYPKDNTPG
jgi:peroxiredoxin Q/BCP